MHLLLYSEMIITQDPLKKYLQLMKGFPVHLPRES